MVCLLTRFIIHNAWQFENSCTALCVLGVDLLRATVLEGRGMKLSRLEEPECDGMEETVLEQDLSLRLMGQSIHALVKGYGSDTMIGSTFSDNVGMSASWARRECGVSYWIVIQVLPTVGIAFLLRT